ncbi:hypothetical protein KT99_15962 [Shewanella benthica KT99]|uniref:Uncharacterized protein n=1 Tax=Shewanella benthica KT99 TaxID=314608 RepID=A9DAB3_9GAMM|nr:hypothetical protein KT99_15962 [Shewanella benthica KT99]
MRKERGFLFIKAKKAQDRAKKAQDTRHSGMLVAGIQLE